MKYLILILSFIPFIAFAQTSSIGLKEGVSFSRINDSRYSGIIGPNIEFIYSANFKKIQLTVEPSLNVKGFSYYSQFTDAMGNPLRQEKVSTRFSYLELPITIGVVPVNEKFILGISAGLAPAFLVSARATSPSYKYTYTNLNNFNLDVIAGLKAGVRLSERLFLALNVRYGVGLLDPNKKGSGSKKTTYSYFSPFMEFGFKF